MVARTTCGFGLLASLPLLVGVAASAQLVENADNPELVPVYVNPAEPADMVFESLEHDFGTISDEGKAEYVFKFTNKGVGTLRITSTKGSCACTVPALEKKEYAPGESGEIRVVFDPKGKNGDQHQQVTVNTNDAETPVIVLQIAANVFPEVLVKPRVGHFGEVAKDQAKELELTVIGRKPEFEVTSFELSDPDLFTVVVGPTVDGELKEEDGGKGEKIRECKVVVTLRPGQEIGLIRNKTLTLMTNDEKHPTIAVELMAQHNGDIDMVPRRVTLGSLRAGEEFHKEVTIKSLSGAPFRVLGIEHQAVASDAVEYSFTPVDPANPNAYRIVIDGSMPAEARVLRGRFVIKTDMEREEELYLQYYAQLRPEAAPIAPAAPAGN
ncbi:MAG TPA: DUF1573 domain-containing protein [Phycisphaerales bacterium]|nr:DUF1573 domain-containing protein [Phycisphaerales bacterium]